MTKEHVTVKLGTVNHS